MRFAYRHNPSLPGLAWLASIDMSAGVADVQHGQFVEVHPRFFYEGAWAGDFTRGRPDETEVVFGSGAVIVDDVVYVVPSLATTDCIYYRYERGVLDVANSLPLLLAHQSDELDPACRRYPEINNSMMDGIRGYARSIPTRGGSVSRLMHHNLRVDAIAVAEVPKPDPPHFDTFDSYREYLVRGYEALTRNARDAARRWPLRIYSTQSRGYDTTAVNAIAAPFGLDGVFTVRTGKGGGVFADHRDEPEVDDDGTIIAQELGIAPVMAIERRAFQQDFPEELYFHASIHECQDANLKQIADHLVPPALLLGGLLGGEMWYSLDSWHYDRSGPHDNDLGKLDIGGFGLTEPRLRAGYVHVSPPYIGGRRRDEVVAITESSAMAAWRLHNDYDRPIPRRIAEEAGVPRRAFGQTKVGSVVEFAIPQVPQGAQLRRRFFAFLQRNGLARRWQLALLPSVRRVNEVFWFATPEHSVLAYYAMRAAIRVAGRELPPPVLWSGLRGALHCYAVNEVADEYRRAIGAVSAAEEALAGVPDA
jgi:hypothetical protein